MNLVHIAPCRNKEFGARTKMKIDRLTRHACGLRNIFQADAVAPLALQQTPGRL